MNIKWIGSPNFGYPDGAHGRNGYRPFGIVLHIMEGTLAGCDSWFQNPEAQASTQYGIGKNGDVHQYVSEDDAAWGNGVLGRPTWPLLIPDVNPNLYTVSIEHEGYTGEPWTEAMLAADVSLVKDIARRWNIPLDAEHIIGHYRIDAINRARCPGAGLPWERLFSLLNAGGSLEDEVRQLRLRVADLQSKLNNIGRLIQASDSPQTYLLKNGILYPIANQKTLDLLYWGGLTERISPQEVAALPKGMVINLFP